MSETKHSTLPWIAATRYSSVVGVPIVAQSGFVICNTAFLHRTGDDDAKRLAEANAAFIVLATSLHYELVSALELSKAHIDGCDYDAEAVALADHIAAVLAKAKQP